MSTGYGNNGLFDCGRLCCNPDVFTASLRKKKKRITERYEVKEMNFDLSRFTKAHKESYKSALEEIRRGRKETHWMWYIFPQIKGLGRSPTSQYYAIQSLDEAKAFLRDNYLGKNLLEISNALLTLPENNPTAIFEKTDDIKLKSCMTLFSVVSEEKSVFHQVLDKYYDGKRDDKTLEIIRPELTDGQLPG